MRKLRAADVTRLVEWGENKHALDGDYAIGLSWDGKPFAQSLWHDGRLA